MTDTTAPLDGLPPGRTSRSTTEKSADALDDLPGRKLTLVSDTSAIPPAQTTPIGDNTAIVALLEQALAQLSAPTDPHHPDAA